MSWPNLNQDISISISINNSILMNGKKEKKDSCFMYLKIRVIHCWLYCNSCHFIHFPDNGMEISIPSWSIQVSKQWNNGELFLFYFVPFHSTPLYFIVHCSIHLDIQMKPKDLTWLWLQGHTRYLQCQTSIGYVWAEWINFFLLLLVSVWSQWINVTSMAIIQVLLCI